MRKPKEISLGTPDLQEVLPRRLGLHQKVIAEIYKFGRRRNKKTCTETHPGESTCDNPPFVYWIRDPGRYPQDPRVFCLCGYTEERQSEEVLGA